MNGVSRKTGLKIENCTAVAVSLHVDQIDNFDWDGVSRPDRNINGKSIPPHNSILEREEINYFALSGSWYRLTFVFSDGRSFRQRFNQRRALDSCYEDRQIYCIDGEDFYVTTFKVQCSDFSDCLWIRISTKPLEKTVCELFCGTYPLNAALQHTYVFTKVGKSPCRYHNFQCYGGVERDHWSIKDSADLELAIAIACSNPYDTREDYSRMDVSRFTKFGDCSGIVYGVTGVCHQMANRILYACNSHPNVFDFTPSAVLSYFAYGMYGNFLLAPHVSNWSSYLTWCKNTVKKGRAVAAQSDGLPPQAEADCSEEEILRELAAVAAPMQTFSQKALALELQTIGDDDTSNQRLDLWIRHHFADGFDQRKEERLFELNSEFHAEKKKLTEQLSPDDFHSLAQLRVFAEKTNSRHRHMLDCFHKILTADEFRKICGVDYAPDMRLIDTEILKS